MKKISQRTISQRTISRILLYIRSLETLAKAQRRLVSSQQLAQMTGLTDVQIRKDINMFGKIGTPRLGYDVVILKTTLEDFVLQKQNVRVVLFGVGNLGSAILNYPEFSKGKLRLVGAFDKDPFKIGKKINGVTIHSIDDAPRVIREEKVHIAILAVPVAVAQQVADVAVLSGLHGIINFAPTGVNVPYGVHVKNIDLTIEFLSLFSEILRRPD